MVKKSKKVLFFIEPSIEFGNPLFRLATLRNSILPQVKALESAGISTCVIVSSPIAEKLHQEGLLVGFPHLVSIDPIVWTDNENYLPRSKRHYNNKFKAGEIERLSDIIFDQLGANYRPDLVISWETPASFMQNIFPGCKIIYQQPGIFSRAPYTNLISMDWGLFSSATNPKNLPLKNLNPSYLDKIRERVLLLYHHADDFHDIFKRYREKFSFLLLFPLQVDGYFSVDGCIETGVTQFELITKILQKIPSNCGLFVTGYVSKDVQTQTLNKWNIAYLRSNYKNFIYDEKLNNMQNVSQMLCPYVDGVFTISSSLGYQAALWKKPLHVLGDSHIKHYETDQHISGFLSSVSERKEVCRDSTLIKAIGYLNFPVKCIEDPLYISTIKSLISGIKYNKLPELHIKEAIEDSSANSNFLNQIGILEYQKNNIKTSYSFELADQISRHQVISFDIFDTLVNRPFWKATDLFDFMQDDVEEILKIPSFDFREHRKKAENDAFQRAIQNGKNEITIDEIYSVFALNNNISLKLSREIQRLEISYELKLLSKRDAGFRAFYLAMSLNKKIILVSDMYLKKQTIEKVLKDNGYYGYDKLYLSSDIGEKKLRGKLYDHVLDDLGIPANQILHVGDNIIGDIKMAKAKGIKPFHLIHAIEKFKQTSAYIIPWARDEANHTFDIKLILSVIAHKFANNPYLPDRRGTLFKGDPFNLGYYGLGPLIFGYVKWVIESAIADGVDTLYFLSRDGMIMKRAYDSISKVYSNAPKARYLYCSRRSVNLCKAISIVDLYDLVDMDFAHRMRFSHFMKNRFGLDIGSGDYDKILEECNFKKDTRITAKMKNKLKEVISALSVHIFEIASEERKNYLQYLKSEGFFSKGKKSIVDIGYAGTMQESLYLLGKKRKKIGGYYLITFRKALQRLNSNGLASSSFLASFIDRHDTYHPFCKHVPMYETLFSAPESSFLKMEPDSSKNLKPVFIEAFDSELNRQQLITSVHNGAIEFVDDFLKRFGSFIYKIDFEPNKIIRVLKCYFENPHFRDARIFNDVEFEDLYGGCNKIIINTSKDSAPESVWQAGRETIIKEIMSNQKQVTKIKKNDVIIEPNKSSIDQNENAQSANAKHQSKKLPLSKSLGLKIAQKTLSSRKFNKLRDKPDLFFYDSKFPFNKLIRKIFE